MSKVFNLKIKTLFNDDLRLLKGKFSDVGEGFSKIKAFIGKSYGIKNLNKFMMQYKDDEDDLVTIATKNDLGDAMKQAIQDGKSLKIFLKRKKMRVDYTVKEENEKAKTDKTDSCGVGIENNTTFGKGLISLVRRSKISICPNNHELACVSTPHGRFICDICTRNIGKGENAYGCRKCDWDACHNCAEGLYFPPPIQFGWGYPGFRCGRWGGHGHGKRHGKNNNNNEKYRADVIENPSPMNANSIADQGIIKRWKMKNVGTVSLPRGLLVKYCGRRQNPMVSTNQFMVGNENEIKPGEEFFVQVSIKTPDVYGKFHSNWRLTTPQGKKFGQKLAFNLLSENVPQIVNDNNKNISDNLIEKSKVDISDNGIDMVINDSDEENNEIIEVEKKEELPEEEEEEEEEVYEYQKQLDKLQAMGFGDQKFLKELLNTNQGRIDQALSVFLKE